MIKLMHMQVLAVMVPVDIFVVSCLNPASGPKEHRDKVEVALPGVERFATCLEGGCKAELWLWLSADAVKEAVGHFCVLQPRGPQQLAHTAVPNVYWLLGQNCGEAQLTWCKPAWKLCWVCYIAIVH